MTTLISESGAFKDDGAQVYEQGAEGLQPPESDKAIGLYLFFGKSLNLSDKRHPNLASLLPQY